MKIRVVWAGVGYAAIATSLGLSVGTVLPTPEPVRMLAPATGEPDWVTTTSSGASFRPVVTASIPPPPED